MGLGLYKANSKDWLVFGLGLFTMIKARILGTFGISELIMMYLLIFKIRNNPFFRDKRALTLFYLAMLWGVSTVITDLYRNTSMVDSAKGCVSIVFLILILPVAYWCLYDRPRRVLYYIAGLSLSAIINYEFFQSTTLNEVGLEVWQVYAYEYLIVFLASLAFYHQKKYIGYTLLILYGVWSLFHLSRNVFMLFVFSSTVIFIVYYYWKGRKKRLLAQQLFNKYIISLALLLCVGFVVVKSSYEYLASSGSLGELAKAKYEMQKNSVIGLASGRADFFISLAMISDSPILGYGSYAKDTNELAHKKTEELGLKHPRRFTRHEIKESFIPGHSYILGAWVYNGILGVPFWIYSLYLILLYYKKGLYTDIQLTPLLVIWSVMMFWNILFSPFSDRPVIVFFLSIVLLMIKYSAIPQAKRINPNQRRVGKYRFAHFRLYNELYG